MEKENNYSKIIHGIICGLLVIYAIMVNNISYQVICYAVAVIIMILLIIGGIRKIPFDVSLVFLFQAMIIKVYYGFFFSEGIENNDIYTALCPILIYILGIILVQSSNNNVSTVIKYYFSLMCGLALNGIIFYVLLKININQNKLNEIIYFFPKNDSDLVIESLLLGFNSAFLYFLISWKKNKIMYSIGIVCSIFLQFLMISNQRRYNAYIFVLSIYILLLYCCFKIIKKKIESPIYAINISLIFGFILLALLGICFKFDVHGLKSYYYGTFWGIDGGIFHNFRYQNMVEALKNLRFSPNNSYIITSNNINTSFNMWLEYSRESGMYVFGYLLVFLLLSWYNFFRMLINKRVDRDIKILLGMAFMSFNILYFFEYVAREYIYIWLWGLFVCGMIRAYSVQNDE